MLKGVKGSGASAVMVLLTVLMSTGSLQAGLVCWGEDFGSDVPQPPGGALSQLSADITDIELGVFVACGGAPSDGVRCLSLPEGDELLTAPRGYRAFAAGSFGACVIDGEGRLACAGDPVPPADRVDPGLRYVAVSVGPAHACAILEDGTVGCWGTDDLGQSTPPADLRAVAVAVGLFHTCAIRPDRSVTCWGGDEFGQAGVPGGLSATGVSAGGDHSCAVTADAGVACWGDIHAFPDGLAGAVPEPVQAVSDGMQTCLRDRSGLVRCWLSQPHLVDGMADPVGLTSAADLDVAGRVFACAVTE